MNLHERFSKLMSTQSDSVLESLVENGCDSNIFDYAGLSLTWKDHVKESDAVYTVYEIKDTFLNQPPIIVMVKGYESSYGGMEYSHWSEARLVTRPTYEEVQR